MPLTALTERALEACNDAVLESHRWPSALQLLAESLGAASCTFYTRHPMETPLQLRVPVSTAHEEFADLWLRNEAHARCPHIEKYQAIAFRDAVVEHQISTEEERKKQLYYRETARPGKREWFAMAGFWVQGRRWGLPIYRGNDRGPFTQRDARDLARIGPYIAKIVSLAEKFKAFEVSSNLSALARVKCAAIVTDALGRARELNSPALDLLGDDFNIVKGRPFARDSASNRRLQILISSALRSPLAIAQPYAPIVVDRDEAPWLLVEAMPVTAFGSDLFSSGRLILLLTDLRSPRRPDSNQLRAAFGLTAAEAKLATRLASGAGIDAAAASLGVSRETARTQLKAVFAKTSTGRQAELAGLLARLRPSEA
jgi:DNA-binding CsgD family transcriptional regulator